jgi:predicted nucleic acid-binding protein
VTSTFTAVYDACVLYPFPLRNLLIDLAMTDFFRARWSDEINAEWMRNLRVNRSDIPEEKILKSRDLMNAHVRDALVTGYESLIPGLTLPDENDRHVLAVAIRCQASVIVTFNLKDFPAEVLEPLEIEAQHPDDFIANLIDLCPAPVFALVEKSRMRLKNPPMSFEAYLEMLSKQKLIQSVSMLRRLRCSGRL